MFLASLLRNAAARLRTWHSRSPTVAAVAVTSSAIPTLHSPPLPTATTLFDRKTGRDPVEQDQTKFQQKRRRPIQPHPTLWNVKSSDTRSRLYCGPVAVAALIGVNVDEVIRVIQWHRNNRRQVRGTHPHELHHAFRHFGHDIQLVADLSRNSPTLATWERERTDWDFEQAWLLIVTGHRSRPMVRRHVEQWQPSPDRRCAPAAEAGALRLPGLYGTLTMTPIHWIIRSQVHEGACAAPEIRQHAIDLDGQRHALREAFFQGPLARGTQRSNFLSAR